MSNPQKILWREGLFLTPQHFQAWDRYHEWLAHYQALSVAQPAWGIRQMDIDREAISAGQFRLKSIRAILRDGSPLLCPGIDRLPGERSFGELLTPTQKQLKVYLAVRKEDPMQPAVSEDGPSAQRFRYGRQVATVSDMVSGTRTREIEFVEKQPEIRFEGEPLEDFDLLPLAVVEHAGAGQTRMAERFLPPSLGMEASPVWGDEAAKLVRSMVLVAASLRGQLPYRPQEVLQISPADVASFLFLQELNGGIARIKAFQEVPDARPVDFFATLTEVAARMASFFAGGEPESWPVYHHEAPADNFYLLIDRLQDMLSRVTVRREIEVELAPHPERSNQWTATLSDEQVAAGSTLYLWIQADMSEGTLMDRIVKDGHCKIAAPSAIDRLAAFAVKGVELEMVATPPPTLPAPGTGQYFRLNHRSTFWPGIQNERSLAIYAQGEFPELKLRLFSARR